MATLYEVEHGVKPEEERRARRPSMSSFFNQINQITPDPDRGQNNPNATPTPVDVAAAARLVQEQFRVLQTDTESNTEGLLSILMQALDGVIEDPPTKVAGVPQSYLDTLDRVPKKVLKKTDTCPICAEPFLDDPYPLVVELPCHPTHQFDLDCVGPWLRLQGTCPLDRKDLMKKKEPVVAPSVDEDEEEFDPMYA